MNVNGLFFGTALAAVPVDTVPSGAASGWHSLGAIFYGVTNIVFYVGVALTIIFLIMGGIRYVTSGGSKEGTEAARSNITSAIIGFIVVIGAFAIRSIAANILTDKDIITLPGWFTTTTGGSEDDGSSDE